MVNLTLRKKHCGRPRLKPYLNTALDSQTRSLPRPHARPRSPRRARGSRGGSPPRCPSPTADPGAFPGPRGPRSAEGAPGPPLPLRLREAPASLTHPAPAIGQRARACCRPPLSLGAADVAQLNPAFPSSAVGDAPRARVTPPAGGGSAWSPAPAANW